MGKGDQRSRRGKVQAGSFGVSRPRLKNTVAGKAAAKAVATAIAKKAK